MLTSDEHLELNQFIDLALMGARWMTWNPERHPKITGERFVVAEEHYDPRIHAPATMDMEEYEGNPMTSYSSPDFVGRLDKAMTVVRRIERNAPVPLRLALMRTNDGWEAWFIRGGLPVGHAYVPEAFRAARDEHDWGPEPEALVICLSALRAMGVECPDFLPRSLSWQSGTESD